MLRILSGLLKVIGGILILLIPIILFYWVLATINLEPLKGFVGFLSSFISPIVGILVPIIKVKPLNVADFSIDLIKPIFCLILLLLSIALNLAAKGINYFDNSVNFVQAKTKVHIVQKQKELEAKEAEKRLMENSIGYVVVKCKSQTTSSAYLASSGLSSEDIKNMFMEHFNRYTYLDAELQKDSTDEVYNLIFHEITSCISYALTLQENVAKLNKDLDKAGIKLHTTIGIYSTTPKDSRTQAFFVANKVCNLCSPGEITCSKDVKSIFEKDRGEHNLKFTSKGMYDLGTEVEIFLLQKML